MALLIRRNRAVQNAVDKPGNRRHRRLQFMGNIRDKAAARVLADGEGIGHRIECLGEFADLVAAVDGHADAEVALAERARGAGHAVERVCQIIRKGPDRTERD